MEVLRVYVNVTGFYEVVSEGATVRMLLFDGSCDGDYFKGSILPGGVDTQKFGSNGLGTLSARYMIEGTDCEKQPCHMFIENNAQVGGKENFTIPKIVTDSKALKWLEQAALRGRIETIDGQLTIIIEAL